MLRDAVAGNRLEEVRRLYEASFPKSEKKPFGFIMKKRKKGFFDVLSIEDDEKHFCGLAIMMLSGGRALLDYLAIAPHCQGTGLGSRSLQEIRERYGEDKVVVEIESTLELDGVSEGEAADTTEKGAADERLRRKAFYLRNGMVTMDFQVVLFGVKMEILTFGSELTFEQYQAIYRGVLPRPLMKKIQRQPRRTLPGHDQ